MKRVIATSTILLMILSTFAILTPQAGAQPGQGKWVQKAPMPTPRRDPAAIAFNGKIYVIGGINVSGGDFIWCSIVEIYDPQTDSWTTGTPMPDPKGGSGNSAGVGAVLVNNMIYVFGGDNRTFCYDPKADLWDDTLAEIPVSGYIGSAFGLGVVDGKIYVAKGSHWYPSGDYWTYRYDPSTDTWTSLTAIPYHRSIQSFAQVGGKLYAIGGTDPDEGARQETNRVDMYDPETDSWELDAIPRMTYHRTDLEPTTPVIDGKMCVMGGWNGYRALSEVEIYDPSTNTWSALAPMPTSRWSLATAEVNGKIYAVGGNQYRYNLQSANEEFTPSGWAPPGWIRLTTNPYGDYSPDYSPDGEKIAFMRYQSDQWRRDIWIMDANGSNQQLLVSGGVTGWPDWSPDGTKIVYSQYHNDYRTDIMVVDVSTKEITAIVQNRGPNHTPRWSPDGTKILFNHEDEHIPGGLWNLYTINVTDRQIEKITNTTTYHYANPDWSPDGFKIVIARAPAHDLPHDIYLMDADGSNEDKLVDNGNNPTFFPDRERILFSRDYNLFSVNTDGTNEVQITDCPPDMQIRKGATVSSDRKEIAFAARPVSEPWNHNIYKIILPALTVYSSPSGVTFTLDNAARTTPWSETYSEGASASLIMPEIHSVDDAKYYWDQWSDGNTSRSRTVTMNTDITLTAYYAGPYYQLNVNSTPVTGVTFNVNGSPKTTLFTEWVLEGSYTLEMPETHGEYVWHHWLEDGDTNRTKTFALAGNTAWTAVYRIPGDVNGDEIVDVVDIVTTALAFGAEPGDPEWNPYADLNGDGIIDVVDLVIIVKHFREARGPGSR